jgi:HK97 family phage major capsid protein
MTITKSLRDELVQNHGLPAGASDKDVAATAINSVKAGKITKARLTELMAQPNAPADTNGKGNPDPREVFAGATNPGEKAAGDFGGDPRVKHVKERFDCTKSTAKWPNEREFARKGLYAPGNDAFYWETRPGMEHITDPKIQTAEKKYIQDPSQFEYAKMGAIFKKMLVRDNGPEHPILQKMNIRVTEEDEMLVKSAMHDDEWVGPGANKGDMIGMPRRLKDAERDVFTKQGGLRGGAAFAPSQSKAPLLGDNTSGGTQAVPQYFDFEAIRIPLLYGELVPFVEITPTDRGASAHSYSIGTPTYVTTASGTAITAFDATSFVTTYDVTFFPASCGFLWGRDFEMDAAPNIGQMIVAQLGDQFKYQMDNWIAVGDGTTQPQGLKNASSTITVTATGASHATMVYNDGLNLMYGITKPYRKAFGGENTMFITSDKEYKKFMQLATGVTGDTRPIYGMHLKDYQLGDYHVAVQNDIADGTVFACNLRGYRLYRRLGLYFELLTTGQTLTLANEKLLFARARFGGKLTLGGYCSVMTSLQIG